VFHLLIENAAKTNSTKKCKINGKYFKTTQKHYLNQTHITIIDFHSSDYQFQKSQTTINFKIKINTL
jgi:hypothetical protein